MLNHIARRLSRSRLLLALLAGLYPAAFFCSHNWYGLTSTQIAVLMGATVAIALVGVCGLAGLSSLALRWAVRRGPRASLHRTTEALWAFVGVAVCLTLSAHPLTAAPAPFDAVVRGALMLALGGAIWAYRSGLGGLNLFLSGLTLLASAQWTYSYVEARLQLSANLWFNAGRDQNERIRFTRTPNVYYVLADGYPSRSALKRIYGFEQPWFYGALRRRGFEIHHAAYSNYEATMLSMSSTFAMAHHYATISIGNLDAYSARDVVAARGARETGLDRG